MEILLNEIIAGIPVPKQMSQTMNKQDDLMPISLMICRMIGGKESGKLLRVLFDSGGTKTMIHERILPQGAEIRTDSQNRMCNTVAGQFNANKTVVVEDFILPEFDRSKRVLGGTFTVFNIPNCAHDVILGRDMLQALGFTINFENPNPNVKWLDNTVLMKKPQHFRSSTNTAMALDANYLDYLDDADDAFILDAKYEATSAKEVADAQKHLSQDQKDKLESALANTTELFDGKLGLYKAEEIHLEIEPNAVPVHSRAYSVPKSHKAAFRREMDHLLEIGVLSKAGPTEWGSPTFIIPKKDGRVRWISDLRELNKVLKRKVYPLPLIDELVSRRSGYKYFTKIDLTMMYYSFVLDEASRKLCTIVTPYGKFHYNRLAMGLKPAPDFAQYYIAKTLEGLDVECYIDDVGIFSNSYEEHMKLVATVVQRLQTAGFKINPLKCEWAVQETDFLGHWLTPTGVKPWKKKIDAVLKMSEPKNLTQLRSFLGAATYYRHIWQRRSHLLRPLTSLTGKGIWEWTDECQKAFDEMKAVMASDILMAFPNPNKPFALYTDASDYQMGAVIMQEGKPVAYWSKKLNPAQQNYSVMEKEMLSIVHCLREYRSMLYGTNLTVYTDHKNLTFRTSNTQRVCRWRLFLDEFSP